jgi:hypothetical protein
VASASDLAVSVVSSHNTTEVFLSADYVVSVVSVREEGLIWQI